jgi:hypothetical protein
MCWMFVPSISFQRLSSPPMVAIVTLLIRTLLLSRLERDPEHAEFLVCLLPFQSELARADGSLRHMLARLGRIDVMVIDDWAMATMTEAERRDFWEICEERYQRRSTILTSQLPISRWHEQIGDPTLADGILDRLVHNAHRIEMKGESMRKRSKT